MNTCETCKWWKKQIPTAGDCLRVKVSTFFTLFMSDERGTVLATNKDFGCNQWEKKEE